MRYFVFLAVLLSLPFLFAAAPEVCAPPGKVCANLDKLFSASVMVQSEGGSGSGVTFKNGATRFVWTDAHVVEGNKKVERFIIDGDKVVTRVRFTDVSLLQEQYAEGRKVGKTSALAKIIRYSAKHDLALLRVYGEWPANGVAFAEGIPSAGTAVWHVGSMRGERGLNSLSDGVFSTAGRLSLYFEPNDSGIIYDQISLTAHPGSSGGGVFCKKSGHCLGIITEFLGGGQTFGAVLMTPARRLREFSRESHCEWAADQVEVPEKDEWPVLQDLLPVPENK